MTSIAVLATAFAVLVGCGGDDSADQAETSETPQTTTVAPPGDEDEPPAEEGPYSPATVQAALAALGEIGAPVTLDRLRLDGGGAQATVVQGDAVQAYRWSRDGGEVTELEGQRRGLAGPDAAFSLDEVDPQAPSRIVEALPDGATIAELRLERDESSPELTWRVSTKQDGGEALYRANAAGEDLEPLATASE